MTIATSDAFTARNFFTCEHRNLNIASVVVTGVALAALATLGVLVAISLLSVGVALAITLPPVLLTLANLVYRLYTERMTHKEVKVEEESPIAVLESEEVEVEEVFSLTVFDSDENLKELKTVLKNRDWCKPDQLITMPDGRKLVPICWAMELDFGSEKPDYWQKKLISWMIHQGADPKVGFGSALNHPLVQAFKRKNTTLIDLLATRLGVPAIEIRKLQFDDLYHEKEWSEKYEEKIVSLLVRRRSILLIKGN